MYRSKFLKNINQGLGIKNIPLNIEVRDQVSRVLVRGATKRSRVTLNMMLSLWEMCSQVHEQNCVSDKCSTLCQSQNILF